MKTVISCSSQISNTLFFSRMTTFVTVAMVVQIRIKEGTGKKRQITLH